MPSAPEIIAQDALFITFPRSDGLETRWPKNIRPPPAAAREVNWHRKMTMQEKYSCRWRNLIGQGIAKMMDKPGKDKYCVKNFPKGYWMFDHNKGPVSNVRHDLYLYGSKTVGRFRSPAEFIPHGYWLLTDPSLNPKNCGCKYCGGGGKKTQTEISESLGLPTNRGPKSVTGGTGTRDRGIRKSGRNPVELGDGDGTFITRDRRPDPKLDPIWKTSRLDLDLVANSTRISDVRSNRRFRIGELVWCTYTATVSATLKGKQPDRVLQLWPAIVMDFSLATSFDPEPFSSGSGHAVIQKRLYTIRRLGRPSPDVPDELEGVLDEDEIMPWHAYRTDSSSLHSSLDAFTFALRAAENLVRIWAVCDRLPIKIPAPKKNHGSFGSHPLFPVTRPPDNHPVSLRSTPPSSTPYYVESTPPLRSPVRLVPPNSPIRRRVQNPAPVVQISTSSSTSILSDLAPPRVARSVGAPQLRSATVTETRYQGLWLGAERIWCGDLVRLCPEREAFTTSLLLSSYIRGNMAWKKNLAPSPGATTRGVLMRIDRIFARLGESSAKECAIAGPLYEVSPNDWMDATVLSTSAPILKLSPHSGTDSSKSDGLRYPWIAPRAKPPLRDKQDIAFKDIAESPSWPLPPAPSGYTLRALLPPGFELPVPASFIAGRYYPDVLQWPLLASELPHIPMETSSLSQLMAMDERSRQLLSLCALAPGIFNHAVCVDVRLANRPDMLKNAMRTAQAELPSANETKKPDGMDVDH